MNAGEIGSRTERADAQIGPLAAILFCRPRISPSAISLNLRPLPHRHRFVSGSSMSRATPLMNCSRLCEPFMLRQAAIVAIGIDIDGGMLRAIHRHAPPPIPSSPAAWVPRRPMRSR